MRSHTRRRFLTGLGAATIAGAAGCLGDGGDGGDGGGPRSLEAQSPEGTVNYPYFEGTIEAGAFEDHDVDLNVEYPPFDAQVVSVLQNEVDTSSVSFFPYINNAIRGEDLVCFGFSGGLLSVNAVYCLADAEYESIPDLQGERVGVWSFGSSTVQSFSALVSYLYDLDLQADFETTTAAPPALLGLLQEGEVDGIINVSGLTITMESQPDTFRNLGQLNEMWMEESGHTLPLTGWFAYEDWYDENQDLAADLIAGCADATEYWRANTRDILESHGEPGGVSGDAQIDVVDQWANDGLVFHGAPDQSFVEATWDFGEIMADEGFLDGDMPAVDDIMRSPM